MNPNNILDQQSELEPKNNPYRESWLWWESKRWFYNVILILTGAFILLIAYGFIISNEEIRRCIFWGIGVNLFYFCGYILDSALLTLSHNPKSSNHNFRRALFFIITISSIFITFFAAYVFI